MKKPVSLNEDAEEAFLEHMDNVFGKLNDQLWSMVKKAYVEGYTNGYHDAQSDKRSIIETVNEGCASERRDRPMADTFCGQQTHEPLREGELRANSL